MNYRTTLFAACFFLTALLLGCGSSSTSTTTSTSLTPTGTSNVNGIFADAAVMGLPYSCGGVTGTTGTGGSFACPTGSTATFSVGGIKVCSAPVQAMMTPVSCAQATDPSANTSTPSVLALSRFLLSISTTPASSGTLTITSAEVQAATNLSLDFTTATDAVLQTIVNTINPGATLVSAATAQAQLNTTVLGALAGSYSGTYSGSSTGTWMVTISSSGSVSGTFTDSSGKTGTVAGNLVNGTTYQGTAGGAMWTGNLNSAATPHTFSGNWVNTSDGSSGTFTGHN